MTPEQTETQLSDLLLFFILQTLQGEAALRVSPCAFGVYFGVNGEYSVLSVFLMRVKNI